MRPTDIRIQPRSDRGIDYENYARVCQAVKELLGMRFDEQYFTEEQTSAGKKISGKTDVYTKDDFHLTWQDDHTVSIGPGYVRIPFLAGTAGKLVLYFSAETVIALGTNEYAVIYAQIEVNVSTNGRKTTSGAGCITVGALQDDTAFKIYEDSPTFVPYGSRVHKATYYIPLYCLQGQVTSGGTWTWYQLVHDCRYSPCLTFDVQGSESHGDLLPMANNEPVAGQYAIADDTSGTEWTWTGTP